MSVCVCHGIVVMEVMSAHHHQAHQIQFMSGLCCTKLVHATACIRCSALKVIRVHTEKLPWRPVRWSYTIFHQCNEHERVTPEDKGTVCKKYAASAKV